MSLDELHKKAEHLLGTAGFHQPFRLCPVEGGANNQVFRVELEGQKLLFLKAYFRHPDDERDRLKAEFSFSRFAWDNGVRALPQPIAQDEKSRLALYEFVEGRHLEPGQVTAKELGHALEFFSGVNHHRHSPSAGLLGDASEASFSVGGHLEVIGSRVKRLLTIQKQSAVDEQASRFVCEKLLCCWEQVLDDVVSRAGRLGLDFVAPIPEGDRCLSPSDFGFHNAILTDDGELKFIDFEYAGWDDPAKLVCDFFCQPAVPVPFDYYDEFAGAVVAELDRPDWHLGRISLLLPAYQAKWCCILLNDFLGPGSVRRRFARGWKDYETRKEEQLQKAEEALKRLTGMQEQSVRRLMNL